MRNTKAWVRALAVGPLLAAGPMLAHAQPAQTPLKIGFISTFSGPEGAIGKELQDAFKMALADKGGKLGGRPVDVVWGDDQTKPDIGRQLADKMLESDKVQLVTGINFSNVLLAVIKPVMDAGVFYVSINAAPSQLAGKGCQQDFFAVSHQNDYLFESVGQYMQAKGVPSVYMIAPNYPAGHDMLNGFKRFYKGDIKAEVYTTFPTLDFASQLADIRERKPAAVLFFLPGGMTVNFIKQYRAAGLSDIPLYTGPGSVDATTLPALGEAALGVTVITNWPTLLDTPASKKFEAEFENTYHRVPSAYAAVAYDTANALDAALTKVGGRIEDKPAFRRAMAHVTFDTVRGYFAMNTNHFPIQNMYATVIGKDDKGRIIDLYKGIAVPKVADGYAKDCHLPKDD